MAATRSATFTGGTTAGLPPTAAGSVFLLVFRDNGLQHLLAAPRLQESLPEGGFLDEARNAREGLEMLSRGILRRLWPSMAWKSTPSTERPTAILGSRRFFSRTWGMATPSPIPVLPRSSLFSRMVTRSVSGGTPPVRLTRAASSSRIPLRSADSSRASTISTERYRASFIAANQPSMGLDQAEIAVFPFVQDVDFVGLDVAEGDKEAV